jgi:hypothetical protein
MDWKGVGTDYRMCYKETQTNAELGIMVSISENKHEPSRVLFSMNYLIFPQQPCIERESCCSHLTDDKNETQGYHVRGTQIAFAESTDSLLGSTN